MEVQAEVVMQSRGAKRLDIRRVSMLPDSPGIWKVVFNLKQELSAGTFSNHYFGQFRKTINADWLIIITSVPGYNRARETAQILNEIQSLRIQASFSNKYRETAQAELLAVAHFSPKNRHIRVSSSTTNPKVSGVINDKVRNCFQEDVIIGSYDDRILIYGTLPFFFFNFPNVFLYLFCSRWGSTLSST